MPPSTALRFFYLPAGVVCSVCGVPADGKVLSAATDITSDADVAVNETFYCKEHFPQLKDGEIGVETNAS